MMSVKKVVDNFFINILSLLQMDFISPGRSFEQNLWMIE
jgi:hypothetical protein